MGIVPLRATRAQPSRRHSRPAGRTRLQPVLLVLCANRLLVLRGSLLIRQSHPQHHHGQYLLETGPRHHRASTGDHFHQPEDSEHGRRDGALLVSYGEKGSFLGHFGGVGAVDVYEKTGGSGRRSWTLVWCVEGGVCALE